MSLRNDQSPEILALDAAVEANRTSTVVALPSGEDLAAHAATLGGGATPVSVLQLSPRFPWIAGVGALYAFHVSRWDTPADLVYCYPNQQPPGEGWDGTVLYVDFTAPEPEDYGIVARYHGQNAIVRLRGPWGVVQKTMPAGQQSDLVAATWSGSGDLFFTLTFSGQWLGSVSAVQIFRLN
jgi:hypothetical protein